MYIAHTRFVCPPLSRILLRNRLSNVKAIPLKQLPAISRLLLSWYDANRRDLPWRSQRGIQPNPYHVWLSEVMLQQTTVATVRPRFQAFLDRWPTVTALATATLDDVLHEWQGLGYYARARNLHACALTVARDFDGIFPSDEVALRALPGIGDYTAAAIAAIAFDQPSAPVDGNIIRVISRLKRLKVLMPGGKSDVAKIVANIVPSDRPGDFAQAMMDLGATVCTPRNPQCWECPWATDCAAHAHGEEERYPLKAPKKEKPTRHGTVFWLVDGHGRVLLRRRPEKGLLGGMMEFPTTDWEEVLSSDSHAIQQAPVERVEWSPFKDQVKHTFTHFHLSLAVWHGSMPAGSPAPNGYWVAPAEFHDHALPTVMKKVAAIVQNGD